MAGEDPRVTCPYDKSHQIAKSRMQVHLVRCEKNHSRANKETCPYNTLHIIDKIQFKNHVLNCPDAKEVQSFQYKCDDKEIPGIISMEVIRAHQAVESNQICQENWDNDFHPTYDPLKSIADKPIIRTLMCESKAKKREFRMKERMRMAQFANETATPSPITKQIEKSGDLAPLRPPRVKSATEPKPLRPPRLVGVNSSESKNLQRVEVKTKNNDALEAGRRSEASPSSSKAQDKVKIPKRKPLVNKSMTEALKHDDNRSVASSIESDISADVASVGKLLENSGITKKSFNTEKKKLEESVGKQLLASKVQDNKNNKHDFGDQSGRVKRPELDSTLILSTTPSSPTSSINSDRPSVGSGKGRGLFVDFVPQPLNLLKARGKLLARKSSNEAQTPIEFSDFED